MTFGHRVTTATQMGLRDLIRRPIVLVLLLVTPILFITRAIANTEPLRRTITVEGGQRIATTMRDLHGADMTTIAIAFLSGILGVFLMTSALQCDARLVRAGFGAAPALVARITVLVLCTLLVAAVALGTAAKDFSPKQWEWFVLGNLLVGLTFAAAGALASASIGRIGATYLVLFLCMLDVGIVQNPMFHSGNPPGWAAFLPGYFGTKVVMFGAFAPNGTPATALLGAGLWCAAMFGATGWRLTIAYRSA